jgi:hypothetical protein
MLVKLCFNFLHSQVLHLCTFATTTSWAVMSEQGDADCAFQMRNGVNVFMGFRSW